MLFKNIYKVASEGGTPSTLDTENYKNGKLPFIKIDDLNQHYLTSAKYFITEKGLKKSSAWLVPENSIIYSNGATIGACSINKIPVTTKQGILGIVPKSNFSVEFLPGQFDQRADSAEQCVKLLKEDEQPIIKTAVTYVLEGIVSDEDLEKIKAYCINPVDSRETDETVPETLVQKFDEPAVDNFFDGIFDMHDSVLKT